MKEETYAVEIKGTSPLLMHRFSGGEEEGKKTKKKAETTKENDVKDTLYILPDGKLYQPAEGIRQSIIEAGKSFKVGRSNLSKVAASFVHVEPEAIIHLNQKWSTDRRAVVIPSTRGRVMRNRGRLDSWGLKFQMKILDADEISGNSVHQMLDHAGKYIGIGDYRPQKKGMYGTFSVISFKPA